MNQAIQHMGSDGRMKQVTEREDGRFIRWRFPPHVNADEGPRGLGRPRANDNKEVSYVQRNRAQQIPDRRSI